MKNTGGGVFFHRKVILIERQILEVGKFDIEINGAYDNIKTFPLYVKKGRKLFVHIKSDNGVDVSIVDSMGMNEKFVEAVKDKMIGPLPINNKGTMALVLGVFPGDLAHVEIEAWME